MDATDKAIEETYLECVKEHIDAKAEELKLNSKRTILSAADNKAAVALSKKLKSHELPDAKSPYFTRIDLATGEILYYGHLSLSPSTNGPVIPDSHKRIEHFLVYSRNSDKEGWSVFPLNSLDGLVTRRIRFQIKQGEIENMSTEVLPGFTPVTEAVKPKKPEILVDEQVALAMRETREEKLRPVGATLQPDQFALIRESADKILAIQGPPGSGKTVVLIERISSIAFLNESIKKDGMILIGPNQPFLDYVSEALEILGNPEVITSTVEELSRWKIDAWNDDDFIRMIKGSKEKESVSDRCIADLPKSISETYNFDIGKIAIDFQPLDSYLLLKREASENLTVSQLRERLSVAVLNILTARYLEAAQIKCLEINRFSADPGVEIEKSNSFRKLLRNLLPEVTPKNLLKRLKYSVPAFLQYAEGILDEDEIEEWIKCVVTEEECIQESDVPILDYLDFRINGKVDLQWGHIAVDEVQDLTPMQMGMLKRRVKNSGTFTLSGDLAQATGPIVYENWIDIITFFSDSAEFMQRELTMSYRVPGEILKYANKFLDASGINVPAAEPFLEIENSLILQVLADEKELKRRLDDLIIENLDAERSVLLVSPKILRNEYSKISFEGSGLAHFKALAPEEVKGFEFDVVIILSPWQILTELDMPDERAARMLYVLSTRATQKLIVMGESRSEVENPLDPKLADNVVENL